MARNRKKTICPNCREKKVAIFHKCRKSTKSYRNSLKNKEE